MYPGTVCDHVDAGGTFMYHGGGALGSMRVCNVCHLVEEYVILESSQPRCIQEYIVINSSQPQRRACPPVDSSQNTGRMKRQLEL